MCLVLAPIALLSASGGFHRDYKIARICTMDHFFFRSYLYPIQKNTYY